MKFAPIDVRPSGWGYLGGTQTPIVRLHAGRSTLAVIYDDLPKLIAQLEQVQDATQQTGTKKEPD